MQKNVKNGGCIKSISPSHGSLSDGLVHTMTDDRWSHDSPAKLAEHILKRKGAIENGPFIVDLPIENGDFP